jgi:hypothetical protein
VVVLTIALSVGTIYASDVNVTDSSTATTIDDDTTQDIALESSNDDAYESSVDNDVSNDVSESETSSTLSTNTEDSNVLKSEDNASSSIDVSKTITSKDVTKYYKGSAKYTATFLDRQGKALANTNVKITVNGHTYTKKTDSRGIASLDINLKPGTYKIVSKNPVTGYSLTNTFKILSTISANDVSKLVSDGRKFYAKFLKNNGKPLAKKKVKFKINGKTYKVKTNSKGIASLSLKDLKKGTYKVTSYNTDGLSKTNKVKVVSSVKTSLTANSYTFLKSDSKTIQVKLLTKFGNVPPKGQVIKFKINGKTYQAKTNKKGVAKLKLPSLKEGKYTVKYSFAKSDSYKSSSTNSKVIIIPNKNPTFTVKSTTKFGHGAGTLFKVALTSGKIPLESRKVTLSVNGQTYTKTTDSNGIVSLPINLDIGKYTISYSNKADSKINSKSGSTSIDVVERTPSSVSWKSSTSFYQGTQSCKFLVVDSNNKPVSGGVVKLTVNSKTYSASVASNGYATFSASFTPGNYSVSYTYNGDNLNAPSSGTTSLNVKKITKVSVKNVVSAASSLKSYYESHKSLPNTITAGGVSFNMPQFLYLMEQAIYQLGHSDTKDITYIEGVSAPSSPSGDEINSKDLSQENYLKLAQNVANYIKDNKKAPNYASSAVGKIIYNELVEASARILAFYAKNNRLPSYVIISHVTSGSSQGGTGLNEVNKIKNLKPYLQATKNCEVGGKAIKKIVDSLTSNLKSDSAKAKAIFNYVKDTLSYSFYYNTKYGATGALSAKKGNCVDHSHLLVAMFRTAGIPARYVHGTCKFSSGSTYGHVWAQVLINGKWTIADATSSRNSLGSVANWNTKSFTLKGIYREIEF